MSISLKLELETWAAALKAYDEENFGQALDLFSGIADSAKILVNMGLIYATTGEHEVAVEHFTAAINLDNYLAIAHFQCGVSNFLLERYDQALKNFEDALVYLRDNEAINYEQLGLKFKLFSAEILFNQGLSQIYLGFPEEGMLDLKEASRQKVTDEHNVIDDAITDRGEGYTVFSIPVGVLYRPAQNKLKNSKSKDYLGKAKLVAAADSNDAFTEFTGVKKLQQASEANDGIDFESKPGPDAAPASNLDRSVTMPAPRIDPVALRPGALQRSQTTLQLGANVVRGPKPTLASHSRRSQSVSNPQIVPPPPIPDIVRSSSALGRSNTLAFNNTLGRSSSALGRPAFAQREPAAPQGPITPQSTGGGAGAGAGRSRSHSVSNGEAGGSAGAAVKPRPSVRKPAAIQFQEPVPPVPPVPSLPLSFPLPFPLPFAPAPAPAATTLPRVADSSTDSSFYNTYMDAYTEDPSRPTTSAVAAPSPQFQQPQQVRTPPPGSAYQQPRAQLYEPPQPGWMQTTASSSSAGSPGHSRTPSSAANATTTNTNTNMNAGQSMDVGINRAGGGGTVKRKLTRRPTRRVTVYDDDEGDDGFVTGEYEEEMANIRVKLHYQDDIRGMMISPLATFQEFVERVTSKFGTSLTGLAMKFKDEDGTKITLRDDSDFELALETARENAKGRSEGKIEVWCVDM